MKTIVCGYDETEPSKRALERTAELAKAFGAGVTVVSVAPVVAAAPRGGGPIDPLDPPSTHRTELAHAQEFLAGQGVEADLQVAVGDPAEAIVDAAKERGADLIVVGTRELGHLQRLLGHSVSESVQRHARCDVLIVH